MTMLRRTSSALGIATFVLVAFATLVAAQPLQCSQGYANDDYPHAARCELNGVPNGDAQSDCSDTGEKWEAASNGTCSTRGDGIDGAPDVNTATFGLTMLRDAVWEYAPVAIAIIAAIFGFGLTFMLIGRAIRKGRRRMVSTV